MPDRSHDKPAYAEVLADLGILRDLAGFGATVIGTPPLGLDLPESDIDVACHAPDAGEFVAALRRLYGASEGFGLRSKTVRSVESTICTFRHLDWTIEVFGQALSLERQHGVRHFRLEQRLLALFGQSFRAEVMALRARGLKTEPAFAEVLGLPGDPYEALLGLEALSDDALRALRLEAAGSRPGGRGTE